MHSFVVVCTGLLAVCAIARALPNNDHVARKTDNPDSSRDIKYRRSRSIVVPHWAHYNSIDNTPFDFNAPAADSQADASPSAHWPSAMRYPQSAAAFSAPPNTFPVSFDSFDYHPVYMSTANRFRQMSTDEIKRNEQETASRKLEKMAALRWVISSDETTPTTTTEDPIARIVSALLMDGGSTAGGDEESDRSSTGAREASAETESAATADENLRRTFDEYKAQYAMYLQRENAETAKWTVPPVDDEPEPRRQTVAPTVDEGEVTAEPVTEETEETVAETATADEGEPIATVEEIEVGEKMTPVSGGWEAFKNEWTPALADEQLQRLFSEAQNRVNGNNAVFRFVLGDRGLRIQLVDDDKTATTDEIPDERLAYSVVKNGKKESAASSKVSGDNDNDNDVAFGDWTDTAVLYDAK